MTLFEIGPDFKVMLNKDWILTVPPLAKVVHRDRGSPGDSEGRKKLRAIKEFTFIFHCSDPRSPIENIDDPYERREKALQYAELTEKDIDDTVVIAQEEYEYLLELSVPTLGLLRSVKGTLTKLKNFFDVVDFDAVDKQGKLKYSPDAHIKSMSNLGLLHKQVMGFEEIVLTELKAQKSARGKMELGDREQSGKKRKWNEGDFNPHSTKNTILELDADPREIAKLNSKAPNFMRIADMAHMGNNDDYQKALQEEEDNE